LDSDRIGVLGARLAMVGNESILLTFGGPAKPALHLKPLESRTAIATAVFAFRPDSKGPNFPEPP